MMPAMSKQMLHELTYDAPLAAVAAMLADPAFREEVCARQKVLRHDVRVETAGDVVSVRVDQVQAAHGIPSFATKFVGDEINIVQEERWARPEAGDVTVVDPRQARRDDGTATLVESGATHHRDRGR